MGHADGVQRGQAQRVAAKVRTQASGRGIRRPARGRSARLAR